MGRGWNIWALTVATGKARPLVAGDYDDIEPQFSPDRRRLAFTSNRSGRWAVYVQDLQAPGTEPRMVSAGLGESDPRWSPSGDTLYYLAGDRRLLAVPAVGPNAEPILGAPRALFSSAAVGPIGIGLRFNYALHPDGRRVLMLVAAGANELPALTVRVGWMPQPARQLPSPTATRTRPASSPRPAPAAPPRRPSRTPSAASGRAARARSACPARVAARTAPDSARKRFGSFFRVASNASSAAAGLSICSSISPTSSRAGASGPGVTAAFSVLSSRLAAAIISASASALRPSTSASHAVAERRWISACSAQ